MFLKNFSLLTQYGYHLKGEIVKLKYRRNVFFWMTKSISYLFVVKCLSKFLINILYTPSAVSGLLQASPIEQRPPFKSCHMTIGISHTPVTKERY